MFQSEASVCPSVSAYQQKAQWMRFLSSLSSFFSFSASSSSSDRTKSHSYALSESDILCNCFQLTSYWNIWGLKSTNMDLTDPLFFFFGTMGRWEVAITDELKSCVGEVVDSQRCPQDSVDESERCCMRKANAVFILLQLFQNNGGSRGAVVEEHPPWLRVATQVRGGTGADEFGCCVDKGCGALRGL